MRKGLFIVFGLMIAGGIVFFPPNLWNQNQLISQTMHQTSESKQTNHKKYELKMLKHHGLSYIDLNEIETKLPVKANMDEKNGTVVLQAGETKASFLKDVSVMEKNGLYYAMKAPLLYQENQIYIPTDTVAMIFDGTISIKNHLLELKIPPVPSSPTVPTAANQQRSADQLITYLEFLSNPIKGAHVSTQDSSLPGAPRTYRKGVHEGVDWYGGNTTGVPINKKTPVQSMADGVVVRADHQYQEMTTPQREKMLALGRQNNGQTPAYVLDKLRGRSVWIQHDQGVMARYVHLERLPADLKVGQKVKKGDLIGYVGNSGTSDGAKGNEEGIHLHLDLFIYGKWPWDHYSMHERRMILEKVFPSSG